MKANIVSFIEEALKGCKNFRTTSTLVVCSTHGLVVVLPLCLGYIYMCIVIIWNPELILI